MVHTAWIGLTNTAVSSARFYYDNAHPQPYSGPGQYSASNGRFLEITISREETIEAADGPNCSFF
ncbi:hypothetical protein [Ktedonobacter robiniae]|uniref:hypothetical protein n=1 Tax=Ktedonobacter robiniae TaxID=2778365 RepID=UPI001915C03A|nr:hypothetical protein [Ktedonobacter robiniae]